MVRNFHLPLPSRSASATTQEPDRPSVADITAVLIDADTGLHRLGVPLTSATATNLARAIYSSGLSDKALRALVDDDEAYEETESDIEALGELEIRMADCFRVEL